MSFDKAILRKYAQHASPSSLPPHILLTHTEHTLTIFDAFPKAHFHFLVLPRVLPPTTGTASIDLTSLRALLASARTDAGAAAEVVTLLRRMRDDAASVRALVEAEMRERYGFVWDVNVGFHAVPSMDHIHLHVISSDLCSPALKTKKHYNSFHPNLGFFLHIDDVLSRFSTDASPHPHPRPHSQLKSASSYEQILKDPLECLHCAQPLKNIPSLKAHLQEHFERLAKKEKARAESKELKRKRDAPQPGSKSRSVSVSASTEGGGVGENGDASNITELSDSKTPPPCQSESRQCDDTEHTQKKRKQNSGSP